MQKKSDREALARLNTQGWDYLEPKFLKEGFVRGRLGFERSIDAGKLTGTVHVYVHKIDEINNACLINSQGFLGFPLLISCTEIENVVAQFVDPVDENASITFATSTSLLIKQGKALKISPKFSDEEFRSSLDHFFHEFSNAGWQMLIKIMQPANLLKQIQYKQTKIFTSETLAAREFALLIHLKEYDQVLDQLPLLEKGMTWAMNNSLTPSHVPLIRQLIAEKQGKTA